MQQAVLNRDEEDRSASTSCGWPRAGSMCATRRNWLRGSSWPIAGDGRGGTVFTLNLDHLVKLRDHLRFRAAYQRGDLCVGRWRARGQAWPRGWASRWSASPAPTWSCRFAALLPKPAFPSISSERRTPSATGPPSNCSSDDTRLVIAGSESPPRGFDPEGETAREAAERIAASGAGICFVALGAPKQELFANLAVCRAPGVIFICIGAALDFIAGADAARARRLAARRPRMGLASPAGARRLAAALWALAALLFPLPRSWRG